MNAPKAWKWLLAILVGCTVSLAFGKLPPPPSVDPAKAEEAKQKAADAAKKEAESLAKSQDRVAERYKKEKGISVATTAKSGAAVKPAAPAAPAKAK